jgi:hypothetical protein
MSGEAKTALLVGVVLAGFIALGMYLTFRREAPRTATAAQLDRQNWTLAAQGFE